MMLKLKIKKAKGDAKTGPRTLIVGDGAVKEIGTLCNRRHTKVLCFTNSLVLDISTKILDIAAANSTVETLILHTGALDVVKQQSEVLKQDFIELLDKVRSLDIALFISGPLPTIRGGDERFSRLLMLNKWLKTTCATRSVNFIDNFNINHPAWSRTRDNTKQNSR